MHDREIKLPPWSKKRRIITTGIITGFILLASTFIGVGMYQTGVQSGRIQPAMTKKSLLQSLLRDVAFVRAVNHVSQLKDCTNFQKKFRLSYKLPFHPIKAETQAESCMTFVTTHPTGVQSILTFSTENEPRDNLVMRMSQEFSTIQTDIMPGTHYETSVLRGVSKGVPTAIYIIGTGIDSSWILTYAPTSPVTDGKVTGLVESFQLLK